MTANPVDQLKRLLVGLERGEIPPDVAKWLTLGLDTYLAGNGSLDAALGLVAQPGKLHVVSEWRIQTRNAYLCALSRKMPGQPWPKAGTIASWCALWMRGPFQAMQERELHPGDLAGLDIPRHRVCFLREASRPGVTLPTSQGRVYELVK